MCMIMGHEDILRTAGEVGAGVAAPRRADAPASGGQRSPRAGSWRGIGIEPSVRPVAQGHRQGSVGDRDRDRAPAGAHPAAGGGTKEAHRPRSAAGGRAGAPDRAGNAGRPGIAVALDVQEHAELGGAVDPTASPDQPYEGGPTPPRAGLQPAEQPQDGRGRRPSRPGRAIPPHQRRRHAGPGEGNARHFRGHQEEGTGRQLRRTRGGNGGPRRSPSTSRGTTFPIPTFRERTPTASTTWSATRAS